MLRDRNWAATSARMTTSGNFDDINFGHSKHVAQIVRDALKDHFAAGPVRPCNPEGDDAEERGEWLQGRYGPERLAA